MTEKSYLTPFRNPFESFWMAGFECTDKLNCFGRRVDFLTVTGHLDKLDEDYKNLALFNIKSVREGIRWSYVEKSPFQYNWKDVEKVIRCAKENNIQVVWDICHFGFPDDLTPLHPMFAQRFAALCSNFIKFYRSIDSTGTLIVTPFNEVSFLSWLGGDVCGTAPFCRGYGWEVKYQLMKAYIEGVEAIKQVDATARLMTTEPLVNMVPPLFATAEQIADARNRHEAQFEVLEILSGRMCPELRGRPDYLDIIGLNYYYNNQWIANTCEFLPWINGNNDPRWLPLNELLTQLYERYQRPIVLSETSHPKEDRPLWMELIATECKTALEKGIPVWGICWYPIIDRPDWDHLHPWHNSGIWDIDHTTNQLTRILHQPTADALRNAQHLLDAISGPKVQNGRVPTF